jgi:hypothetical protein
MNHHERINCYVRCSLIWAVVLGFAVYLTRVETRRELTEQWQNTAVRHGAAEFRVSQEGRPRFVWMSDENLSASILSR